MKDEVIIVVSGPLFYVYRLLYMGVTIPSISQEDPLTIWAAFDSARCRAHIHV